MEPDNVPYFESLLSHSSSHSTSSVFLVSQSVPADHTLPPSTQYAPVHTVLRPLRDSPLRRPNSPQRLGSTPVRVHSLNFSSALPTELSLAGAELRSPTYMPYPPPKNNASPQFNPALVSSYYGNPSPPRCTRVISIDPLTRLDNSDQSLVTLFPSHSAEAAEVDAAVAALAAPILPCSKRFAPRTSFTSESIPSSHAVASQSVLSPKAAANRPEFAVPTVRVVSQPDSPVLNARPDQTAFESAITPKNATSTRSTMFVRPTANGRPVCPETPMRTPPRSPLLMVQQTLHRFDIDMAPLAGPAELSLGATNSGRSMMSQDSVLQPSDGRNSIVFSINQSAASATSNSLANSANQISSTAADPSERREIDFERLGHLGHGQFGDVAHVRDKHSPHHEFALKRSLRPFISERARVRFMNEMSYVHQCSPHPNIVRHISAWQENGHAYVQMELCRSGTLYAALKSGVLDRYSSMWLLLHDMASALSVIHAHRLVHMDIKPTNIYVDTNGASPVFKLGDFGLCCLEHNAIDDGDKLYLAPEFFRSLRDACSTAADIFSLGTTLYELYCQFDERLPSTGAEYQALRSDHIVFPEHIPDLPGVDVDAFSALSFRQIIQCMMSSEPANRPTAVQLMQHQCCKEALALARPAEVDTLPASSSDTHVLSPTPAARVASVVGSESPSCRKLFPS